MVVVILKACRESYLITHLVILHRYNANYSHYLQYSKSKCQRVNSFSSSANEKFRQIRKSHEFRGLTLVKLERFMEKYSYAKAIRKKRWHKTDVKRIVLIATWRLTVHVCSFIGSSDLSLHPW